MARYMVIYTLTETSCTEVYVEAENVAEAEAKAKSEIEDNFPKMEVVDSEDEYEVSPLPEDHEVRPIQHGPKPTECRLCGKPVHWTGRYEGEGRDRITIPGPWVHS